MDAKRLMAKFHVDTQTDCTYRYIFSETERFTPHCHDYFELFLTVTDGIVHIVNGRVQRLKSGTLVLIRPDDVHDYQSADGGRFRFVNLTFTQETVRALFDYLGFHLDDILTPPLPPTVLLSKSESAAILSKFSALSTIKLQDKGNIKLNMRLLLIEIFARHFLNAGGSEKSSDCPAWLETLCTQMNRKENFEAGMQRMTELSGKSREHVARCVKQYFGVPVSAFVNDLRLNYAANMLINSNIPILELCFESGFQNVSWFYTLFKEKYGMPPKAFRKRFSKPAQPAEAAK